MSASTTKKVLLERFDRDRIRGYVNLHDYLRADGVEILLQDGSVGLVPYAQIKAVSFVRDLEGAGVLEERREFLARPKTVGLWVELVFRDGDRLEGVLPNNLLNMDTSGYSFTPPETGGNAQRVFVPRQALEEIAVLGVVGGRRRMLARGAESQQIKLFSEE